jgi:hypothetical protein
LPLEWSAAEWPGKAVTWESLGPKGKQACYALLNFFSIKEKAETKKKDKIFENKIIPIVTKGPANISSISSSINLHNKKLPMYNKYNIINIRIFFIFFTQKINPNKFIIMKETNIILDHMTILFSFSLSQP